MTAKSSVTTKPECRRGDGGPSAILAVLRDEMERTEFVSLIEKASRRLISTVSILEASMVLEGKGGEDAGADLDQFLRRATIEPVAFDEEQLAVARMAFRRFGKGRHAAGLNFGNCAAYALAQWSGEPLLFKGSDFAATDVSRVRK